MSKTRAEEIAELRGEQPLTTEGFAGLGVGDIIRQRQSDRLWVVMDRIDAETVIVSMTQTASHPNEWALVSKSSINLQTIKPL